MQAGLWVRVVAAALVLATLPLSAASATDDDGTTAEGPLQVEVDRPLVMLGDPVEVEIEYELEVAEAEDPDEGEDEEDTVSAADEGDEGEAAPAEDVPVSVTFTVDLGDGGAAQTHTVDGESDGNEIEAELELTHTYAELGAHDIVVTATPEGGEAATATTSVEVTDQPVAYPRSGDDACGEDDETDTDESDTDATEDGATEDDATEDGATEDGATEVGTTDTGDSVDAAGRPEWVPPAQATEFFADVPEGSTHGRAISCLVRLGLVSGISPGNFAPGRSVSREQLASLLVRAIERSGVELPAGDDAFDDVDGSTHEASINALAAAGLISGTGDGSFNPKGAVTRAQMATLLTNVYERIAAKRLATVHDYFDDDAGSTHEANINRAAAAGFATGTGGGGSYAPGAEVSRAQITTFLTRMLDRLVAEDGVTL